MTAFLILNVAPGISVTEEEPSTRLSKDILHCFRMLRDNSQQNTRWCVRACSTLFPISERAGGKAELSGELRLAQSHFGPDLADVDFWYLD